MNLPTAEENLGKYQSGDRLMKTIFKNTLYYILRNYATLLICVNIFHQYYVTIALQVTIIGLLQASYALIPFY